MKPSTAINARMRHPLQLTHIRKPLLTTALTLLSALMLCVMSYPVVYAGEPAQQLTMQATEFTYDPAATEQLKGLYCIIQLSGRYSEGRIKLKELVEQEHADPNVVVFSTPLLSTAIMQDDYEFTELLLKRGAQLNHQGHSNSLSKAETPKMAQLLIDNKADVHAQEWCGNLLHDAARNNKPAKMIAFLCNTGVDCNLKNKLNLSTPVHTLFYQSDFDDTTVTKTLLDKITIFLWAGADLNSPNEQRKTSLDIVKNKAPDLVAHVQARMTIVPQIKQEKEQEYQQNFRPLLANHITKEPAGLVEQYLDPLTPLPWHKNYLPDVECRVTQELAALTVETAKKPTKRSRSQSPARTSKK